MLLPAFVATVVYMTWSYWITWEKPALTPVLAIVASNLGNTTRLDTADPATQRYTQGILVDHGIGVISRNASIFLPFTLVADQSKMELDIRSLFVAPGFSTEVEILLNDVVVAEEPLGLEWKTIGFQVSKVYRMRPNYMKIRLKARPEAPSVNTPTPLLLRFDPGKELVAQRLDGSWSYRSLHELDTPVPLRWRQNILGIGSRVYDVDKWPITVALVTQGNLADRFFTKSGVPVAGLKTIRVVHENSSPTDTSSQN